MSTRNITANGLAMEVLCQNFYFGATTAKKSPKENWKFCNTFETHKLAMFWAQYSHVENEYCTDAGKLKNYFLFWSWQILSHNATSNIDSRFYKMFHWQNLTSH